MTKQMHIFTDTHTHPYLEEFDADRDAVMERALAAGVGLMVLPNVSKDTIRTMRELHGRYPDNTVMAMGLHPSEINENWQRDTGIILDELESHPADYIALGEVGIDLYWDRTFEKEQMKSLDRQFAAADRLGLPAIIHCREGLDQTLEVLEGHPGLSCVFHCFGGNAADVEKIRCHGDHYFGIGGVVTFRNSRLREVLPEIGPDRILLETDAPYLAPVPHRGRRNESSFLPATAAEVSRALGLTIEETAARTVRNAAEFFKL